MVIRSLPAARSADRAKLEAAVRLILEAIGEDPGREGLRDTPRRVAAYLAEATAGLHLDPARHLQVLFNEAHEELVLVRDVPFHSLCEHHVLPFLGKAHVAYVPRNGHVAGLSKLARVVEDLACRPQLQERTTSQVAGLVMDRLDAQGVLVCIEAEHLCMTVWQSPIGPLRGEDAALRGSKSNLRGCRPCPTPTPDAVSSALDEFLDGVESAA